MSGPEIKDGRSSAREAQIRGNPEGGKLDLSAPTSRRLIVLVQSLLLLLVVGRNGEATVPRDPTIR